MSRFSTVSVLSMAGLLFVAGCSNKATQNPTQQAAAKTSAEDVAVDPPSAKTAKARTNSDHSSPGDTAPHGRSDSHASLGSPDASPSPTVQPQQSAKPPVAETEPSTLTKNPPAAARPPKSAAPTKSPANSPANSPKSAGEPAGEPLAARPLFAGWTHPLVALVITGQQEGYIEPCGCAGLENQKGGLSRRQTFVRGLEAKKWPLLALDLGGQVRRFGKQAEQKFNTSVKGLHAIGYRAIGFGPADLRLPTGSLLAPLDELDGGDSPYLSANVGLFGLADSVDAEFTRRYEIVERGGVKIGVTAVLGDKLQAQVNNGELEMISAEKALAEVAPQLADACDIAVLLCYASPQESAALAKKFPIFNLVVTAGGADEPPAQATPIAGTNSQLLEVGHKGMYASVVGVFNADAGSGYELRFQRVPLDKRFGASDDINQLMVDYQNALRVLGYEGLDIRPQDHASGRAFVGSATCAECHTSATDVWKKTPHSHATKTLVDLDPPRHFDAECLSCHVTGWSPQKFYPYTSGYLSREKTAHLLDNGCENCHGPGSRHVAVELGDLEVDEPTQAKYRAEMRLTMAAAEKKCLECHDLDNSPDFDFETYWPEVAHKGKD